MAELTFSRDEVETAAEVGPWRLQREFSSEIDPDDMGDTARVYQRAAGEAADTGELAERATEIAEDSGGADGATLVDGGQRDGRTAAELAGNGEDMDRVSRYLDRAMRAAEDTEVDVRSMIVDYLELRYAEHLASAEAEYQRRTNLSYFVGGERQTVEYTDEARPDEPAIAAEIRSRYLGFAAEDAQYAHFSMTSDIDEYRRLLTQYGQELDELGYDVTAGPLTLWTSPEMARYAAEGLRETLTLGGDPELVEFYTETLRAMADDVMANVATADPRSLSVSESRYLEEFFAALDPATLAALGNLPADGLSEEDATRLARGQSAVGDGVMMLLNTDINVPDPEAPHRNDALRAFTPYLAQLDGPLFENEPDSAEFREALTNYNGFGELLTHATVPADDGSSRRLAETALTVQERSSEQYRPDTFPWVFDSAPDDIVENTGSGGLLSGAGRNQDTANDLLSDSDFTDRLLGRQWGDSAGVADFVGRGTTHRPPELDNGVVYGPARDAVLAAADDHEDQVAGSGHQAEYGHVDHPELRDVLDGLRDR
ncbi:hypothetical protein [Streptomyces hainanensis]|uniref:Uncharacterized protein n=1 Tax=Streptomyces hainanensis TaxID=402648 RepID=A0A4R4TSN8_9ACTN|nr:hypothetical protein [Streptomyces hainanensis]TDC77159.1 hypothetical protein E1283_08020 [Streptomyces hainanensis]